MLTKLPILAGYLLQKKKVKHKHEVCKREVTRIYMHVPLGGDTMAGVGGLA
jgi:hypothetical protein